MRFESRIKEKIWDHRIEKSIWDEWVREEIFKFNPKSGKQIFVIDTPPPYPSGRPWHIGAAAHYSQIDMIARTARMLGFEVLFPIGIDRNGLPVEIYTEKKYGVKIHDTPREKFIELCKHALDDLESEMIQIMKTLGLSGDFENYYRTDSEEYRKLTQATFIELWNRGLIYEATRPNNYCPVCRTTIADAEVEYKELPALLVYIKFKVAETGENLVIATTRPELLCSCQAVIVNPKDERYKHLHGKHAIVPIYKRKVPIMPHPYAKIEFGTGAVMVCSYGDYSDVLLFRELKLKEIVAIDIDGKMTKEAGKYAGLSVEDARKRIIKDLESMGLIVKKEEMMHKTPTCERSKNPIEIIPMKEYYLKQLEFKEEMLRIAKKLKFHPEIHRQLLINWINSITIDWPISRRRYYGTEIPIWYCKACGKPNLPKPGNYYQPWREDPPFKKCKHCGSEEGFVGETRTLDTWMDSSISPLFISGYLRNDKLFKKAYPTTLRPQGKDIVRTWLYYTLLRCYQLTGKPAFKHVWISGMGLDEKGEKMSKSKGNVIDPVPLLEKYGADAFRFWNASEASHGFDFRCSEKRIEEASKFLTKLWNVARFVSMFPIPRKRPKLMASDEWILSEVNKLIEECMKGYGEFNFYIPSNRVREFIWNLFAPHYVEMVKKRAYGEGFSKEEQEAAWYTLHQVLKTTLLLLAPITPFITDYVWKKLYGKESIHLQRFPKKFKVKDYTSLTESIVEFNSKVWGEKKRRNVSLKEAISIEVPKDLRIFNKDLIAMHNLV